LPYFDDCGHFGIGFVYVGEKKNQKVLKSLKISKPETLILCEYRIRFSSRIRVSGFEILRLFKTFEIFFCPAYIKPIPK